MYFVARVLYFCLLFLLLLFILTRCLLVVFLLLLYANSTAASAFALLAPHLLETIAHQHGFAIPQPALLVFPLISVIGAAVAALAYLETQALGARAVR